MLQLVHQCEAFVYHGHMCSISKLVKWHSPVKRQWQLLKDSYVSNFCLNRRTKHTLWRTFCGSGKYSSPVSSIVTERAQALDTDLKKDAKSIFKNAVNSVRPRKMIENVLHYDKAASTLKVEDTVYHLNRNIFIVGFGKATLGMARAVEDVLGVHIVSGIISIPRGLPKEMAEEQQFDSLLTETTLIDTYESSHDNQVDEAAHNAAKAINGLVTKLSGKDLVIVLCSGGGSVLFPAPHPPITLNELHETATLLAHQGASMRDLSILRKSIEYLKGGGLVKAAKPAQVLCLILSSIVGDSVDLMAGGPTYPCQPTPRHTMQIIQGLGVKDNVPASVIAYLEKSIKQVDLTQSNEKTRQMAKKELENQWEGVQNVIVGNNSVACEAAARKATELGYMPLVLTTKLQGEARKIGAVCALLAKFIMMCFDRKVSSENNKDLAQLEVDLILSGMKKEWLNSVIALADTAYHMDKDICIISGGEMVVNVKGKGIGGKNMECALGAVCQMKKFSQGADDFASSETRMAFLSADTDGYDGLTKLAGAVIDNEFVAHVVENNYDIDSVLCNNDSLALFKKANGGQNLIDIKLTGTNVMDMVILLVKRSKIM